MNRWHEIELAAADYRRQALRDAKEARRAHAARVDQPRRPPLAQARALIGRWIRETRATRAPLLDEAISIDGLSDAQTSVG